MPSVSDLSRHRRNACPTAHVPLAAADGALLRIRVPGGRLTAADLRAVADAAERSANGIVELTSRANLQLRGFSREAADSALDGLIAAGLVRLDADEDARCNVIGSPLAGIDADTLDTGPIVDAISTILTEHPAPLSPKFGVIVDGGGPLHLRGLRHDIVLGAATLDEASLFEIALGEALPTGRVGATPTVLVAEPSAAPSVVVAVLGLLQPGERGADLLPRIGSAALISALTNVPGCFIVASSSIGRPTASATAPIGRGSGWVAALPTLGRMSADGLRVLANIADWCAPSAHGPELWRQNPLGGTLDAKVHTRSGGVRITPWRSVVVPVSSTDHAGRALASLGEIGMCTDVREPAVSVIACAGSTGCSAGQADTQADARTLIELLRSAPQSGTVHLSGCPKRCASRATNMLTLVAIGGRYDVFDGNVRIADALSPTDALALAATTTI